MLSRAQSRANPAGPRGGKWGVPLANLPAPRTSEQAGATVCLPRLAALLPPQAWPPESSGSSLTFPPRSCMTSRNKAHLSAPTCPYPKMGAQHRWGEGLGEGSQRAPSSAGSPSPGRTQGRRGRPHKAHRFSLSLVYAQLIFLDSSGTFLPQTRASPTDSHLFFPP